MFDRFVEHIEETGLAPPTERGIVAFSGGPDSTCLLHLLVHTGRDVVAAHLDHGQRPESRSEALQCAQVAQFMGVGIVQGAADVPRLASDRRIGLEEAGRMARYEFLHHAAEQMGATWIATGHTRDDHIETVLFHLVRGTGLAGLAGIPARNGSIVRPLLPFTRQETRDYCLSQGLPFHDDPCNHDLSFARVRLREQVVPILRNVHPGFEAAVANLARLAEEENRMLDAMAASLLEQAEIRPNGPLFFLTKDVEAHFETSRLALAPHPLVRRAVHLLARLLGGEPAFETCDQIAQAVRESGSAAFTFGGGSVVAEVDRSRLVLRQLYPDTLARTVIDVPGVTASPSLGWVLVSSWSPASRPDRRSLETCLDPSKCVGDLYARAAQPGDRIAPLGFDGTRKLFDLMGEAGLTAAAKARLPVICDMMGPIWAPGVCVSERCAATVGEGQRLSLKLEPWEPSSPISGNLGPETPIPRLT